MDGTEIAVWHISASWPSISSSFLLKPAWDDYAHLDGHTNAALPRNAERRAVGMYGTLSTLHEKHQVTLATFAGPDQSERAAVERLSASGVDLHVVWRTAPAGLARWHWRSRLGRAGSAAATRCARSSSPIRRCSSYLIACWPSDRST